VLTFSRLPSAILLAIAIGLTACGSPSSPAPTDAPASDGAPSSAERSECERLDYPCTFADVDAAILDRTVELADDTSTQLASGAGIEQVAAGLADQHGVVDVTNDAHAIRFRIDGGRAVWVVDATRADSFAAGNAPTSSSVPPSEARDMDARAPTGRTTATLASLQHEPISADLAARVVGTSPEQKSAILLSPFSWISPAQDSTSEIATMLEGTRGYGGRVTHRANDTERATNVTVESFLDLDGNSVVFVRSTGASICRGEGDDEYCHGLIAAQSLPGKDLAPLRSNRLVGVELMKWNDGWDMGIGADFFSTYYPNGISHAFIFFNVPDLLAIGLMTTVPGPYSTFLFWRGERPTGAASAVAVKVMRRMAEGGVTARTMARELASDFVLDGAELAGLGAAEGGSDRIREIVWLRDPDSMATLESGAHIAIDGETGDGEPDVIPFLVDVDGLTDEEADHTDLIVQVDDDELSENMLASQAAEKIDENTWRFRGEVQLARDLADGQKVKLRAFVQLGDEGGLSSHTVEAVVGSDSIDIGTVWEGDFRIRRELQWEGVTQSMTVHAIFTRDPNEAPDADKVDFTLTGGTFTWSTQGTMEGDGCTFVAPTVTVPLEPDEYSIITFDRSGSVVTYSGIAEYHGESVDVTVQGCNNPLNDFEYATRADGVWFYVPRDEPRMADEIVIEGSRGDGGTMRTWTMSRVR
jgi:hypothetical protein